MRPPLPARVAATRAPPGLRAMPTISSAAPPSPGIRIGRPPVGPTRNSPRPRVPTHAERPSSSSSSDVTVTSRRKSNAFQLCPS